jgi:hypothetical protein
VQAAFVDALLRQLELNEMISTHKRVLRRPFFAGLVLVIPSQFALTLAYQRSAWHRRG